MSPSRRTLLSAAAAAGATASLPLSGAAHATPGAEREKTARARTAVRFRLDAEVLDGGEQITSVTLATSRLGRIDPATLTTGTFTVHATARSPLPIAEGDAIFSEYDLDRQVTAARLDRHGDIVLELASGEGVAGASTLGYIASRGRNVRLDLTYTITQNTPLNRNLVIERFTQGRIASPEVDAFSYHESRSGMKYRLYAPAGSRGRRPLVVWLHGGGEGGSLPDYYDNETTLRANRGALGFATREAQRIFRGAYVVVPQSPSFWLEDGPRYAPQVEEIIREVTRRHPIDRDRISVAGASNGGYMSLLMTTRYPDLFASSVPVCGVVTRGATPLIADDELRAVTTPTWLVTSRDDTTVPPEPNTVHAANLIPGAFLTLYDEVVWNGYKFPGHWSWIYVARNDPTIDGTRIWQWMARQRT